MAVRQRISILGEASKDAGVIYAIIVASKEADPLTEAGFLYGRVVYMR